MKITENDFRTGLEASGMSRTAQPPGRRIDVHAWCETCQTRTLQSRRVLFTDVVGVREASTMRFCVAHRSSSGIE